MSGSLILILPELVLFGGAMALLLAGVYASAATDPHDVSRTIGLAAISLLVAAAGLVALQRGTGNEIGAGITAFNGAFILDDFAVLIKILVFLASALAILMSQKFMVREKIDRFEYPVLILLATCGMGVMVSANDMIAAYMGIELQSLALYVMAAIKRGSFRATEAGLKYFVLGALSSGLLLYGMSLIYGVSGSIGFADIAASFGTQEGALPIIQSIGIVFVIAGLAFKVAAVPFHMWTPDVYEGAPTPVTTFFATAPKLAAMALFLRVMTTAFPDAVSAWQQILIFLAIAGMGLGAFAAIGQSNIKRLMAYSSIAHIGFALVGFASATPEGITATIFYMMLYLVMNLGAFACILSMRRDGAMVEQISDLAGLSQTRPFMAGALGVLMFSLAGIPPMAGFFGKLYVFQAAIAAELYTMAIFGVLASVVGAYYYLRIVKIIYLDEPGDEPYAPMPRELSLIAGACAAISLFFFIYPMPVLEAARFASAALLGVQ